MASTFIEGLNLRVRLDAPAPRLPAYSILGSPGAASAIGVARWEGGAAVIPYPAAMPVGFDPCLTGTLRLKDTPAELDFPDPFDAFTAYLGEICTAAGIGDWTAWKARADNALAARTAWALERQLAWATFEGVEANPHLSDADAALPAGASAVEPIRAIAWLEDWLSQYGQEGVIHLTPAVATWLGYERLRDDGGTLRTASGTPVIVGRGYEGTDAENLDPQASGAAEAPAGSSWIFASSPIQYATGAVFSNPENLSEALDRETNEVVYRAERELLVTFDGGPHAAVLADWTP